MEASKRKFFNPKWVAPLCAFALIVLIVFIAHKLLETADPVDEAVRLIIESEMKLDMESLFLNKDV